MNSFVEWLYASRVSTLIRDVVWIIPLIQTLHILAIAAVFGSALIFQLRLVGLLSADQPVEAYARRYLPWIWRGLGVLLATGLVMLVGEPERVLLSTLFWTKMALVVGVALAVRLVFWPLRDATLDGLARFAPTVAWVNLAAWLVIIACGRWIAYL